MAHDEGFLAWDLPSQNTTTSRTIMDQLRAVELESAAMTGATGLPHVTPAKAGV